MYSEDPNSGFHVWAACGFDFFHWKQPTGPPPQPKLLVPIFLAVVNNTGLRSHLNHLKRFLFCACVCDRCVSLVDAHMCVCVLRLKEVFECLALSETGFLIKPGARLAASKL